MVKLGKQYYITSNGEKKVNCYKINIPKEVVEKTNLKDKKIKIVANNNKIVIKELKLNNDMNL